MHGLVMYCKIKKCLIDFDESIFWTYVSLIELGLGHANFKWSYANGNENKDKEPFHWQNKDSGSAFDRLD